MEQVSITHELIALRQMKHPFVVQLKEVFEEEHQFVIVMEFVEGENLLSFVLKKKIIPEEMAKRIFLTICLALQAIHAKGLVHRDIKMENILITGGALGSFPCKVLDFGLAHSIQKINSREIKPIKNCGTPGYIAPELIQTGTYDFSFDLFSLGIVLYIMLTASFPFAGKNQKEIIQRNVNCNISFFSPRTKSLSKEAKDLMASLIVKDPTTRLSLEKAINHPWLMGVGEEPEVPLQTSKLSTNRETDLLRTKPDPKAQNQSKFLRKKSTQKTFGKQEQEPGSPRFLMDRNIVSYNFLMAQGSSVHFPFSL